MSLCHMFSLGQLCSQWRERERESERERGRERARKRGERIYRESGNKRKLK